MKQGWKPGLFILTTLVIFPHRMVSSGVVNAVMIGPKEIKSQLRIIIQTSDTVNY